MLAEEGIHQPDGTDHLFNDIPPTPTTNPSLVLLREAIAEGPGYLTANAP